MSTYTSKEEAVEDVSKRGHDILSKFGIKGYRNDNLLDRINHTITFTSFENNVIGLNWFCEDIHAGDYVLIGDVFSGGKIAKIKERLPTKDSKVLKFWYEETVIKYENIDYEGFGDLEETIDQYYSEIRNANKPKKKEEKRKKINTIKCKAIVVPILTILYMTYIVFANVYYHYYLCNLSERAENAFYEYNMNQYKYESMNTYYIHFKRMKVELTEKFDILDILIPKLITDENVLTQDQRDFLNHKYEKLIEKYNKEKLKKK